MHPNKDSPTAHGEDRSEAVSLQPMEDHVGADFHPAAHAGHYNRAGGYVLKKAAAHRDPMLKQTLGRSCNL